MLRIYLIFALCLAFYEPIVTLHAQTEKKNELNPTGQATGPGSTTDSYPQVPAKKKMKKVDHMDLNELELEQLEENWESTNHNKIPNPDNSVKIKEIVEPSSEYTYASFGTADPFTIPDGLFSGNVSEASQSPQVQGQNIQVTSILQRYPLKDLAVKGVWKLSSGETRASVLTPKNEGVVIKEGDPISSGKVLKISREEVKVRQYKIRADGVREFEDVDIKIGAKEESRKGVIKLEPGKEPDFPYKQPKPETDLSKMPIPKSLIPKEGDPRTVRQAPDGTIIYEQEAEQIGPNTWIYKDSQGIPRSHSFQE